MKKRLIPERIECEACDGRGEVITNGRHPIDPASTVGRCRACDGEGTIENPDFDPEVDECEICGDGVLAGQPCSCDITQEETKMPKEWFGVAREAESENRQMMVYSTRREAEIRAELEAITWPALAPFVVVPLQVQS